MSRLTEYDERTGVVFQLTDKQREEAGLPPRGGKAAPTPTRTPAPTATPRPGQGMSEYDLTIQVLAGLMTREAYVAEMVARGRDQATATAEVDTNLANPTPTQRKKAEEVKRQAAARPAPTTTPVPAATIPPGGTALSRFAEPGSSSTLVAAARPTAAGAPAAVHTYPENVEQWRPLVEKYFRPEDVDKALWVIQWESGGDPAALGDGGHSVGLFQHNDQGLASGRDLNALTDPEANVRLAAEAVYGTEQTPPQGWGPWGEGRTYNGQPFGALGAHPYDEGAASATAAPVETEAQRLKRQLDEAVKRGELVFYPPNSPRGGAEGRYVTRREHLEMDIRERYGQGSLVSTSPERYLLTPEQPALSEGATAPPFDPWRYMTTTQQLIWNPATGRIEPSTETMAMRSYWPTLANQQAMQAQNAELSERSIRGGTLSRGFPEGPSRGQMEQARMSAAADRAVNPNMTAAEEEALYEQYLARQLEASPMLSGSQQLGLRADMPYELGEPQPMAHGGTVSSERPLEISTLGATPQIETDTGFLGPPERVSGHAEGFVNPPQSWTLPERSWVAPMLQPPTAAPAPDLMSELRRILMAIFRGGGGMGMEMMGPGGPWGGGVQRMAGGGAVITNQPTMIGPMGGSPVAMVSEYGQPEIVSGLGTNAVNVMPMGWQRHLGRARGLVNPRMVLQAMSR